MCKKRCGAFLIMSNVSRLISLSMTIVLLMQLQLLCVYLSFDIKFIRQGFVNTCRTIQHVFSKRRLLNLISKDLNRVFYLSVYLYGSLFKLAIMTYFSIFVLIQGH